MAEAQDRARSGLDRRTLFFYSLTDMPVTMALFPVLVFVPQFYTVDMGVSLVVAANIILAVRIMDVFTDPLVGYLSDRINTPWGRRKPWIVASVPLLMAGFYMLFLPPDEAGALHMFVWMLVLSFGTTMLLIPYYAWGAELSPDYNERSRVTGWRSMMGVVGNLVAQLAPAIVLLATGLGGSAVVLQVVGITMLILLPICMIGTVTQVADPNDYSDTRIPVIDGLKVMIRNAPFRRLVLAFMLSFTGLSITTPLYLFFITFVLGAEDLAVFMLIFFYVSNFAAVPFWVWLSQRIGKHRAYIASFLLIAAAHPFYLLLGAGDFWWMLPITVVTGISAGAFAAMPNSMKADVIDLDTLESGENRAALFFSTWSFTQKMAASLGGWLALAGLAVFGFDPSLGLDNTPDQLFGVRFLFALFPSLFYVAAALTMLRYPITEQRHQELRAELAARGASP